MAVTTEDLLVKIQVDTANANKSLETLTKELLGMKSEMASINKASKETASTFKGIGAAAVKVQAGIGVAKMAFDSLKMAVNATVGEFFEAQDEQIKLVNILKLTGDNVQQTYKEFQDFAEQMQATTTVSDGMATTMLTTAKSMGLTNEEAKKLVTTAADLAGATDGDVNRAFSGLVGTLKGNGKSLGELSVLVRDLTKDELMAGKGVDRLAETFKGQGQAALNTFGGQAKFVANQIGEMAEQVGEVISDIFNMEESSGSLGKTLQSVTKWIQENKGQLIALGKEGVAYVIDGLMLLQSAMAAVLASIVALAEKVTWVVGKTAGALEHFGIISKETEAKVKGIDKATEQFGKNLWSVSVEAFKSVGERGDDAFEKVGKKTKIVDENTKSYGKTIQRVSKDMQDMKGAGEKALEDLSKLITDLGKKGAEIGATEAEIVRQRLVVQQEEIDGLQEKLKLAGMLGTENQQLIAQARELANANADKERRQTQLKHLKDLKAGNEELALQLRSDSLATRDLIEEQLKIDIKRLKVQYESADLDAEGRKELEDRIRMTEELAAKEKAKAPSTMYDSIAMAGRDAATAISSVMTSGALEVVGGMASGVGQIVDAVDAMLDMIPNMLNKISGVLDKATALGDTILNAATNLSRAVTSFIKDAIPNLLRTIPEIVDTILSMLYDGIPSAFEQLVQKLPDAFAKLADRAPEIAEKFVSNFISNTPRMAVALTDVMVLRAPEIGFNIMKVMATEMPKAIVRGIVDGVKRSLGAINDLFSGKGPKLDIDMKSITKGMKAAARTLSGEASKLFAVMDLTDSAKAADTAKNYGAQIEDGFKKGGNWLKALWDGLINALKAAWQWIKDNIIGPFLNMLTMGWTWIRDNILMPFYSAIVTTFSWVRDNVFMPLVSGLQTVFGWVVANVISPITSIGQKGFQWVYDNVVVPLSTIGQVGFKWVYDNVVRPLQDAGQMFANFRFPGFSWPALPEFRWPSLPEFRWPELPTLRVEVPGGGGGGGGGIVDTVSSWFANGGLVKPLYAATGLMVPRGTDTVPSMLTPGEFVVNRGAVASLGVDSMRQINRGQLPQAGPTTINVTIDIKTEQPIDDSFFRNRIMPKVKEELRRASLDGAFIVSAAGVRS